MYIYKLICVVALLIIIAQLPWGFNVRSPLTKELNPIFQLKETLCELKELLKNRKTTTTRKYIICPIITITMYGVATLYPKIALYALLHNATIAAYSMTCLFLSRKSLISNKITSSEYVSSLYDLNFSLKDISLVLYRLIRFSIRLTAFSIYLSVVKSDRSKKSLYIKAYITVLMVGFITCAGIPFWLFKTVTLSVLWALKNEKIELFEKNPSWSNCLRLYRLLKRDIFLKLEKEVLKVDKMLASVISEI